MRVLVIGCGSIGSRHARNCRARFQYEILETLAVQTEPLEVPEIVTVPADGQLGLFQPPPHPVLTELKSLDLNRMSPMDAFETLRRIVGEL